MSRLCFQLLRGTPNLHVPLSPALITTVWCTFPHVHCQPSHAAPETVCSQPVLISTTVLVARGSHVVWASVSMLPRRPCCYSSEASWSPSGPGPGWGLLSPACCRLFSLVEHEESVSLVLVIQRVTNVFRVFTTCHSLHRLLPVRTKVLSQSWRRAPPAAPFSSLAERPPAWCSS